MSPYRCPNVKYPRRNNHSFVRSTFSWNCVHIARTADGLSCKTNLDDYFWNLPHYAHTLRMRRGMIKFNGKWIFLKNSQKLKSSRNIRNCRFSNRSFKFLLKYILGPRSGYLSEYPRLQNHSDKDGLTNSSKKFNSIKTIVLLSSNK